MAKPLEQFVDRPEELPEVCEHLAAKGRFGFDTEFVGEDSYHPQVCLIQVATDERLIVIDPLAVGPLDEFWNLLTDPRHLVVAHAAREEIRQCYLATGRPPANIFDLQVAAGLVGLAYPLGHGALVSQLMRVQLSKTETLTEWRERPLTHHQIRYAYDDVRYLLALHREIERRLHKLRREEWAKEEFARLVHAATRDEPAQEKWRKLRGAGSLRPRQLAVLRSLYQWRESLALKVNRPPRIILRDDLLVEIARRNPTREKDLQVVRGLNRRDLGTILEVARKAQDLPPEDWPEVREREADPPQTGLILDILSAVLGQFATEAQLAANLVCTSQDLRALARPYVAPGSPAPPSLLDQGWRREYVRPVLEAVLRGEQAVRLARPDAEAPLELRPVTPGDSADEK
jgi:ribonuclease D